MPIYTGFPLFSAGRVSAGVLTTYARAYIRAYIRTRTAIFRLQKHKFLIKSKVFFGYSIFMLTFAKETTKTIKQ